jgi:hypothetical protein
VSSAGIGDVDGDRLGDFAIAAPGTEDQTRTLPGESGSIPARRARRSDASPGRSQVSSSDACSSTSATSIVTASRISRSARPHRRGRDRVGRLGLRSGRTGAVLTQLFGDKPNAWFGLASAAPDPRVAAGRRY